MRKWLIDQLRRVLRFKHEERRRCYRAIFQPAGALASEAETVLADLRRFCKVNDSSFVPGDPHSTSLNEGRREVWNRILAHLYLTDDQIMTIAEHSYPTDAGGMDDED